jgi:ATP synthase protein I
MRGPKPVSDPHSSTDADPIKALEARIAAARLTDAEEHHMKKDYSQAQLAWRMVIELVAGLGIGFGVGYGLDILLGTMPIFLVLFIFLGFAAGVKTMLASAQEMQTKQLAKEAGKDEDEERGD